MPESSTPEPSSPEEPGQSSTAPASRYETEIERDSRPWLSRLISQLVLRRNGSLRENLEHVLAADYGGDANFSPEERVLLGNILRLREVRVEDVMVPRADIDAVDENISLGDLMEEFRASGHSRMPVYHETLDDPRGMVHIKDLLSFFTGALNGTPHGVEESPGDANAAAKAGDDDDHEPVHLDLARPLAGLDIIRTVLFVPPSMRAADLMAQMQASRVQMALVIDEYGGTDGLVSLEDLVETVVGDIEDEHDEDEEPMLVRQGEGAWVADARVTIEDLEAELGAGFDVGELSEEIDTLGGLLFTIVGRVPVRGELISADMIPGLEFEVMDADPRRVKRVKIIREGAEGLPTADARRRARKIDGEEQAAE
ncbi:hemolysin family protein [Breoghania corrubedonensis]|uniref:hemolysin family protein n=1 Tax=Breoghania corrubedonensis TaxID=665038 RepID=UPI001FE5B91C|nr:hemolysin family protein [Breoghania corrubedonensis]